MQYFLTIQCLCVIGRFTFVTFQLYFIPNISLLLCFYFDNNRNKNVIVYLTWIFDYIKRFFPHLTKILLTGDLWLAQTLNKIFMVSPLLINIRVSLGKIVGTTLSVLNNINKHCCLQVPYAIMGAHQYGRNVNLLKKD